MIKSIITIFLTVLLIIAVSIISFTYGINQGYKIGAISVKNQVTKYVAANSIQKVTLLMHASKMENYKELNETRTSILKGELKLYFLGDEMEKQNDPFNLFINKDSKNIKNLIFYDNLSNVQQYIKGSYTKEEINDIEVFKKLLEKDFSLNKSK